MPVQCVRLRHHTAAQVALTNILCIAVVAVNAPLLAFQLAIWLGETTLITA